MRAPTDGDPSAGPRRKGEQMLGDEYREAVPSLEDLRVGIKGTSRFPGLARICEAYWEREE